MQPDVSEYLNFYSCNYLVGSLHSAAVLLGSPAQLEAASQNRAAAEGSKEVVQILCKQRRAKGTHTNPQNCEYVHAQQKLWLTI